MFYICIKDRCVFNFNKLKIGDIYNIIEHNHNQYQIKNKMLINQYITKEFLAEHFISIEDHRNNILEKILI